MKIASTHDLQGVKGESPAIFKHEVTYYCSIRSERRLRSWSAFGPELRCDNDGRSVDDDGDDYG